MQKSFVYIYIFHFTLTARLQVLNFEFCQIKLG